MPCGGQHHDLDFISPRPHSQPARTRGVRRGARSGLRRPEIERPTGGGGIGIGIDLFGILKGHPEPGRRRGAARKRRHFAQQGPQMPALAGMGRWQIDAVLKGGWPVVVSTSPAGTAFEVSFEVEGETPMHRSRRG